MDIIKRELTWEGLSFRYSSPHHFLKTQWGLCDLFYFLWRCCWFFWLFTWLALHIFHEILDEQGKGWKSLIYATDFYSLALIAQSGFHFAVLIYHKTRQQTEEEHFKGGMKWYLRFLWYLTCVSFDGALMATFLYWTLVFKDSHIPVDAVSHTVNSVYVILDTFVSANPVRLLHVVYSCSHALGFVVVSSFYNVIGGTKSEPNMYSIFDWSNSGLTAALVICLVTILIPLVHVLQFSLYSLRLYVWQNCCHKRRARLEGSGVGDCNSIMSRVTIEMTGFDTDTVSSS